MGDQWRDWWLRLIKTAPVNWCKWQSTWIAVLVNGVKASKVKGLSGHQPKWVSHDNHKDMMCAKIIAQLDPHLRFSIWEGLIWTKNQLKHNVICIPRDAFQRGRSLIEIIINHAHQTIGHYGQWKTSKYIQWSYWWLHMATNIETFCRSCGRCQTNKTDTQKPQGLLHSLPVPDKPWQLVGMVFMGPLPWSQGNDYLLVIIAWLMSQVHLVPTTMQVTAREVAWLFLKEVVRLHGVPESIVSDDDTKFMSMF